MGKPWHRFINREYFRPSIFVFDIQYFLHSLHLSTSNIDVRCSVFVSIPTNCALGHSLEYDNEYDYDYEYKWEGKGPSGIG